MSNVSIDHSLDAAKKLFSEELRQFIWRHDPSVILVDFFDTLMLRGTDGQSIKRISCHRLAGLLQLPDTGESLFEKRVAEEKRLCASNLAAGLDDEFRFQDLANELASSFEAGASPTWRRQFIETFLEVELSTEIGAQYLNRDLLVSLREFALGRRLILVSDFYLGSEDLAQFLIPKNIRDIFERVFTSSDHLMTKRSGRLYSVIKETLGLDGSRMVMIGDNAQSDVAASFQAGISAFHYVKLDSGIRPQAVPNDDALKSTVKATPSARSSNPLVDKKPGDAGEIATILFAYLYRMLIQVRHDHIKNLVFVAREGYLLRDLFAIMTKIIPDSYARNLRVGYFYGSRRSTFLPSIAQSTPINFDRLFAQYRNISIREFLLSLGFGSSDIDAISSFSPYDATQTIQNFPASKVFADLRGLRIFQDRLSLRATNQTRFLRAYFASLVDRSNRKVALADVGWKGTIQDNLDAVLGDDFDIRGYYLGLVANDNPKIADRKRGLLFDNQGKKTKYFDLFAEVLSIWEILCAAPHGSTVEYVESPRHKVLPRLEYTEGERESFRNEVGPFQTAVQREFAEICRKVMTGENWLTDLEQRTALAFWRVAFRPSEEITELYGRAVHLENFGRFMVQDLSKYEQMTVPDPFSLYEQVSNNPSSLRHKTFWPIFYIQKYGNKLSPLIADAYRDSMSATFAPMFSEAL